MRRNGGRTAANGAGEWAGVRVHDWTAIVDASGTVRYASPSVEHVLRIAPATIVGRPLGDLVHPDDAPRVAAALAGARSAPGAVARAEYRGRHADGTWCALEATASSAAEFAGAGAVLLVLRAVGEQRRLEEQLRHAERLAAVGQLVGGVAHDLNNLLLVITAGTRFARSALPPGAAHEELDAIDEAAGRATRLTRQLLSFGRTRLPAREAIDLYAHVRDLRPILRRLIREDITILTLAGPEASHVVADPGQVEQVLVNLAVNARDAMPNGGTLTIETANASLSDAELARVGAPPGMPPGEYARLRVRDTGVGMDAPTRRRIFEPYFTTKAPGIGTGLGLATVGRVVDQLGGFVHVDSRPGAGTTVEVYLPLVGAREADATHVERAGAPRLGGEGRVRGAVAVVLVVEDDAAVRSALRRMLARDGYTVLEAPDGRTALRLVEDDTRHIDLVVTDVVMPSMSGPELAARLAVRRPGTPVLFMSGYGEELAHASPVGILEKPFTHERLTATVRDALDRTAGAGGR